MKALAGELGVEVDLAGGAENPVVALYAGIRRPFSGHRGPGRLPAFRDPHGWGATERLGRVRADQRYVVQWGDRDLVQTEVGELKATWKQRFGELI